MAPRRGAQRLWIPPSPLTAPTHRYSLFCTYFMAKCLSASVQYPGVPTYKHVHPCSLCTPHHLSSAAHREMSAPSASPKGEMSCEHPEAAHFGFDSQAHWGWGWGRNHSSLTPTPWCHRPSNHQRAHALRKVLAKSLSGHTTDATLSWWPCPELV